MLPNPFTVHFVNKLFKHSDYSVKSCLHIIKSLIRYDRRHKNICSTLILECNEIHNYNGLAELFTDVSCDVEIFDSLYMIKKYDLSKQSQSYLKNLDDKMYSQQSKELNTSWNL